MNPSPWRVSPTLALLACLAVGGCAVGPDFKPPGPPQGGYADAAPPATVATPGLAGGEAQRFTPGGDIAQDWWTLFHSAPLNALIARSLAANHDLKAAQAALSVARENTLAQRGAYFPSVAASFGAARTRTSGALAPTPSTNAVQYNLFTPQVSVAYSPDVFGLNRRMHESLQAQEQAVRDQMLATYLTLTANVANAAIQEASLQAQVDATRQLIEINGQILDTLNYQFSKGYVGQLEVAAQRSQLAQVNATLPPLLTQLAQQRDLLATLTGRFPSQATGETVDLSTLTLPQDLPLSLPSALVAQRPDVLQAEANLHAASAQIGVAIANRLPNIQLTGDAGSSALAFSQVFGTGGGFWDLGAAVSAPVFQGGSLLHQERAAKASYVQASEQYRATVLTAFQNVADTLAALEHDAQGLRAAATAADAAKVTLDLSQRQWRGGYASYISLLNAEQAYQQARITLVQAQASRYADTTALYQALGGGWWNRASISGDKHAN